MGSSKYLGETVEQVSCVKIYAMPKSSSKPTYSLLMSSWILSNTEIVALKHSHFDGPIERRGAPSNPSTTLCKICGCGS